MIWNMKYNEYKANITSKSAANILFATATMTIIYGTIYLIYLNPNFNDMIKDRNKQFWTYGIS